MKTAMARWFVAVVVALLVMCPHIRMYSHENTRYFAYWDYTDALAIELIVLVGGSALFVGHALVRKIRSRWINRISNAMFVLLLGFTLLSNLEIARDGYVNLSWSPLCYSLTVVVMVGSLLTCLKQFKQVSRACAMGCLICSPVIPIIFVQMLCYSTYPVRRESLSELDLTHPVQHANNDARGDVYVFVFDAWSYNQSVGRPGFEFDLPNLAAFADNATVYHDAHSLFAETYRSLPSIIYQTDEIYEVANGGARFKDAGGNIKIPNAQAGLFRHAADNDYQTFMVGWSHPYRLMLGDAVDFAYSGPSLGCNPNALRFDRSILRHLKMGLATCALSVPKPLKIQWPLNRLCDLHDGAEAAVLRAASIHGIATSIASRSGGLQIAILHYPIPHGPFVFNRNGYDPTLPIDQPLNSAPANSGLVRPDPGNHITRYRGNLQYMDTLLGEFIRTLKRAGRHDNATIVLTSDHSWRVDPAFDHLCIEHDMTLGGIAKVDPPLPQLTHVPLLVKAPQQLSRFDIHESVRLTQLGDIIEQCQYPSNRAALALQDEQAMPSDSRPR